MAPTSKGLLDKLPADVRHSVIALAAALLSWGAKTLPSLHLPTLVAVIAGPVLTMAMLYVTKLTKQYGIGK